MSGPPCSLCQRPDVADIEAAAKAQGNRAAGRAFGIHEATIRKHLAHVPKPKAKAEAAPAPPAPPPAALAPDDIDGRLRQLAETADTLRADASQPGAPLGVRGQALNACRSTTAEIAKLVAAREQGREPELLTSPAWLAVRKRIVDALVAFPEAARVVAGVMRELEG